MKYRGLKISFFLVIILSALTANAQDYKSSIGLRVGTYSALSFKYLKGNNGIEAIAGISRQGGQSAVALGSFYHRHSLLTADIPTLKWYYGGGIFVTIGTRSIAITSSIGLEYTFENAPFTLFIDGIPYIDITNDFRFGTEASIGVRYILSGTIK